MRFRPRRDLHFASWEPAARLLALLALMGCVWGSGGLPSAQAQPDSVGTQFEEANAAYQQGRYEQALEAYQDVLSGGHASGALYHNLGNTYVRLGRLGQAIRYYEKARRLMGRTPQLEHSLEQARRRAGVYPGALPVRGWSGLVQGWPVRLLFVLGLLLLSAGGAVAVGRTTPGQGPPWRAPAVWGPVVAGGLVVAVAFGASALQERVRRAVVVADEASVYRQPSTDAAPDTLLPEGTLLEVRARQDGWAEVWGGADLQGWVPDRALGDV